MATLEDTHLAELHAMAGELGIERYRMLARPDLVEAILERDPEAGVGAGAGGATESKREESEAGGGRAPRSRRGRGGRGRGDRGAAEGEGRADRDGGGSEPEREEEPGEPVSGVLDITPRGHGFIRRSGLDSDEGDVYVSPSQIRRCELKRGDEVAGPVRKPRRDERYPALVHVDSINGAEPGEGRPRLSDATPVHPTRRIRPEPAASASADDARSIRTLELLNPLAFGQRVLIRAGAASGRTTLLRALAAALDARDEIELVVLLIDERPEEVADWREAAPGADLAVATAEMRSGEQLRLVELAFGRASRRAETGADVVLLVDSLSRIAVAADDPDRAKPLFAAGRETEEEGIGSLTVIATTLADGDDDGDGGVDRALDTTESSLLVLDPDLAAAGVFPAIDPTASRMSGEEHVRDADELAAIRSLRAELGGMAAKDAAALVGERVQGSPATEADGPKE